MTSEELAAIRARVEAVRHYAEIALADALTRYEDAAERFHRETGLMAPGKSEPMAWGGSEAHDAERRNRWEAWLMGDTRRRSSVEVELADDVARLAAEVERLTTALEAERTKRRAADAVLSAVAGWVYVGGAAFKPPPGAADSFGDGMRAAKNQIADILRRHLNPTSWSVP